jgi:hypothetical protein
MLDLKLVNVALTAEEKAERRELERQRRAEVKARDLGRKQKRANKRSQAY